MQNPPSWSLPATEFPRPLRIFVVENHADTLKYITLYLEQMGHTVCSARSMAEALDEIPRADCHVLLSDIGLPDGDGWELLHNLQEKGLSHPVYAVAMSGFGMNANRLRSREAGFRHHLIKPFNPEEIDAILDEAAHELAGRA